MIKKTRADALAPRETFCLIAPRPPVGHKLRKLAFFALREGPLATIRKIRSRRLADRLARSAIGARGPGGEHAVSFDAGRSFYVSDQHRDEPEWHNPFSFDLFYGEPLPPPTPRGDSPGYFILGCGDHARTYLLPHLPHTGLACAVDYNDTVLDLLRARFRQVANHHSQILPTWAAHPRPVAFICTYHSDHARTALDLLATNPRGTVFVEKPPATNATDAADLVRALEAGARIGIGFNRRWAALTRTLLERLEPGPRVINVTIKELRQNPGHWYFWPNQGTRIAGNLCHWIDYCQLVAAAEPVALTLLTAGENAENDFVIAIRYADGSLASITASDAGSDLRGVQEQIEVRSGSHTLWLDDFLNLVAVGPNGRQQVQQHLRRDKGHHPLLQSFLRAAASEDFPGLYPATDLRRVMTVMMALIEMLEDGQSFRAL